MPLVKLSAADLSARVNRREATPEYVSFLRGLAVGEGGQATIAAEGASRQTVKSRLLRAGQEAGVQLRFHRSGADTLIFEVVAADGAPRRRGRPRKAAG